MARLHEYQGKELLEKVGIPVPKGRPAKSPDEVREVARELGGKVMLKIQAWITGRAGIGGIKVADSPEEAYEVSRELFGMEVGNFKVDTLLVEEKLDIEKEYFASLIVDDVEGKPLILFSSVGGTGIEEIAKKHPEKVVKIYVDLLNPIKEFEIRNKLRSVGISGRELLQVGGILHKLFLLARKYDTRSAEINPLVKTKLGKFFAADCRIAVDDYAVYRHPELGIEIARELDRPPTELDRIAYRVEEGDYRGTFYFIQLEQNFKKGEGYIGFHGAGGGGSMMSMDAIFNRGYKIANFCDTSGNPPASKVYRAARIILSQKNIDGYFGSGSGVASQEQFHSARGLVKAFREAPLGVPAVIRLGGNSEDKAVQILTEYTKDLPVSVEGYKKNDTPDYCAERLDYLIKNFKPPKEVKKFAPPKPKKPYRFKTLTGEVVLDHDKCAKCETKVCVQECVPGILKIENGLPVLAISEEEAKKGKCIECLACEIECWARGNKGGYVYLPIEGLEG
ncbi:MAG: succinyl-CoA synthetase subunit beta [Candidatus Neomarinimicrobiota bacterium]|nr:MAG: succinyl-CoA synthetase subunit beta [Candidatus Neomarinimicrobiota bacterium]